MNKQCSKCKTEKPGSAFGKDRHRAGGVALYCRDCTNAMGREWHSRNRGKYAAKQAEWARNNKEKGRARSAAWRSRNPEKARGLVREVLLKRYGLTVAEYEAMYAAQGGSCAICGEHFASLCVDHCHESGRVRGLLCKPCNLGIGNLSDSIDRLLRAVEYLSESFKPKLLRSTN